MANKSFGTRQKRVFRQAPVQPSKPVQPPAPRRAAIPFSGDVAGPGQGAVKQPRKAKNRLL